MSYFGLAEQRFADIEARLAALEGVEPPPDPPPPPPPPPSGLTVVENLVLKSGESGLAFDHKRFTGVYDPYNTHEWSGTVFIGKASNITFTDCVFDTCTHAGYNTFKVITEGATVSDIRFVRCLFRSAGRMAVEINHRGGRIGPFSFSYCTFEPSCSEPFSIDGNCESLVLDHCVFGGGGYPRVGGNLTWTQNCELADLTKVTATNNLFCTSKGAQLNMRGDAAQWVLSDNQVLADAPYTDALATAHGCPSSGDFPNGSGIVQGTAANTVYARGVIGGSYPRNRITNKNAWSIAYLDGCQNMDWRTSTWSGPNATPYLTGCSGLLF